MPVKKSVTPEYIVCLEDGKKFKSLKRHLRTHYDLSPEDYRENGVFPTITRWLPRTTPRPAPISPSAWVLARGAASLPLKRERRRIGASPLEPHAAPDNPSQDRVAAISVTTIHCDSSESGFLGLRGNTELHIVETGKRFAGAFRGLAAGEGNAVGTRLSGPARHAGAARTLRLLAPRSRRTAHARAVGPRSAEGPAPPGLIWD